MFPLGYCIPDELILDHVPEKTKIFSDISQYSRTYTYKVGQEQEYYEEYQTSRFAHTSKKGGWDCMRHYEILANGCIPFFENLQQCPSYTMYFFPKKLLLQAYSELLPWDDSKIGQYNTIVFQLLDHCRQFLSTSAMSSYFIRCIPTKVNKILMIQSDPGVNYSREFLSIGLRREYGDKFIDVPKLPFLYTGDDLTKAYGNGFTYGHRLEDIPIDRENISQRILNNEFDLIIYGKVGYDEGPLGRYPTFPWIQEGQQSGTTLALIYGGDGCQSLKMLTQYRNHLIEHKDLGICFIREFDV